MVAGKGLKQPGRCLGSSVAQNRPNGDVGHSGVVAKTAPVYDDRMDDWKDINTKDAQVANRNLQRWHLIFDSTFYDRKFETFRWQI